MQSKQNTSVIKRVSELEKMIQNINDCLEELYKNQEKMNKKVATGNKKVNGRLNELMYLAKNTSERVEKVSSTLTTSANRRDTRIALFEGRVNERLDTWEERINVHDYVNKPKPKSNTNHSFVLFLCLLFFGCVYIGTFYSGEINERLSGLENINMNVTKDAMFDVYNMTLSVARDFGKSMKFAVGNFNNKLVI